MHSDPNQRRIFVQIASYRDPQCHATVKDLFEKATYPARISVGICWQYDPEEDMDCFALEYPRADQVRVIQYHIRDAQGAGWARNQAQTLFQGEDYVLQIQAHMRFEPGWDATLIELLHKLPTEKSVLTAWLPGYEPPDKKLPLDNELPIAIVARLGEPGDAQMMHLIKRMVPAATLYGKALLTCSWVGNFLFARASVLKEVPFDPYIYFWGEEINYSARLWTHGYDIYHLDRVVLYHYWDRKDVRDGNKYRDHSLQRNQLSLRRNLHLFGLQETQDKDAIKLISRYPLGTVRSLDDYWKFAGYDLRPGTISRKAREGSWSLSAGTVSNPEPSHPKIFVAMASYRDPQCSHTLRDLFAKASHPERIVVGVCLQIDPTADKDCLLTTDRPGQVRTLQTHYSESKGANWGRAQAHTLRQDEEYVLQIDSHMRFEPGWDAALIDMMTRAPSEKPVISGYLPNFEPPDKRDRYPGKLIRICVRKLGSQHHPQLVHVTGVLTPVKDKVAGGLYVSPFFIANFMFCRAQTIEEVPVDPHFQFYGDEISYAARLWTHGYDIFQPDQEVMFHYWVRLDTADKHVHYRNTRTAKSKLSYRRVRHLLGLEQTTDKEALEAIERYGLGHERRLEDLWKFAGIDWKNHSVTKDALKGRWNLTARRKAIKPAKPVAKKAKKSSSASADLPRIFVQIASYRDEQCQHTIKDLFDKAAHPERIIVGICWQFIRGEDDHCFTMSYPYPAQVRVYEVDARESKGMCWARAQAQKLWQGEEYTLQIDSSMRFEKDWDTLLLDLWAQCGSEHAVLTCYPPNFTPPDLYNRNLIFGIGADAFGEGGLPQQKPRPAWNVNILPEKPVVGALVGASMIFAPGSIITDVPSDPFLGAAAEETMLGLRFWTHGYDLFYPNRLVAYHHVRKPIQSETFNAAQSVKRMHRMLGADTSNEPATSQEYERYGLGKVRSLEEYQQFSGIDFGKKAIATFARKGEFTVKANPRKNGYVATGKSAGSKSDIFVQIASYRDRECQWTIKDLFEKARHPERIQVGVCWQFDPKEDEDCFYVSTRPEQVRMLPTDWREGEGVCWARHQTQQLWEGEEYTLQIDSHMRFVPGWDELMIDELRACEADKPVISCNPAGYLPPNHLQPNVRPTVRRVMPFMANGNVRGKGEWLDRVPEKPLNGAFVAAGFVFSKANIIAEVPYDPYMYFDQEEVSYAARLYTHGWDVFSAREQLLYHYYNDQPETVRPLHWRDLSVQNESRIQFFRHRGISRFNHLTGYALSSDPAVTQEMESYGFGQARTLAQFEQYSGIDFKHKIASEKALRCLFIKNLDKYRDTPIHIPELDSLQPGRINAVSHGRTAVDILAPAKMLQQPPMFEKGDIIPFFELEDTNNKIRKLHTNGGKHTMFFLLPSRDVSFLTEFFKQLQQQTKAAGKLNIWLLFVLDDTVGNLKDLKERLNCEHALIADPERSLMRGLGLCRAGDQQFRPTGYLLNPNMKIISRHMALPPSEMAVGMVRDCRVALDKYHKKFLAPQLITEMPAPAIIVQDALSQELCDKCINAFRNGHVFDGTVGGGSDLSYRPDSKVRTDHIVGGKLLDEIDEKLSRSLFPEIQKIFGFDVLYREIYKVGLYTGEKKGFFRGHRDNFDAVLGYRRIAMTLHLSENFEGGGLKFPEYGEQVYRTGKGSAIAFPSALMHEALPVTKGERFILVGFFHGADEEAWRRQTIESTDGDPRNGTYTPTLRYYPGLPQSRDFLTRWRRQNTRYDGVNSMEPVTTDPVPAAPVPSALPAVRGHVTKKTFESPQLIILDDFLPEDSYRKLHDYAQNTDYQAAQAAGAPEQSTRMLTYTTPEAEPRAGDTYPSQTSFDLLVEHMLELQPHIGRLIGTADKSWNHFSMSAYRYSRAAEMAPAKAKGENAGSYIYFLTPDWSADWGGMLLVGEQGHPLFDEGLAKCILPRKNRMVYIANDVLHMITKVNEGAGNHTLLSLSGVFSRKKS